MNNERESNEDDKMAKHTIFSCLSAHTIKPKGERKRYEGKYIGRTLSKWLQKADD